MSGAASTPMAQALLAARARLAAAGVPSPDADAQLLAAAAAGVERSRLPVTPVLTAEQAATLEAMLARRAAREPLQHILGLAWFRRLELSVGPGVFVPRPETELLVDVLLAAAGAVTAAPAAPATVVLDACSGSGAVALSIATERPGTTVLAVEASPDAFSWLSRNVAEHEPQLAAAGSSVTTIQADVCADWSPWLVPALDSAGVAKLDAIVSNPPYIPSSAVPQDPEVRDYDPTLALYSGDDGLDVIRAIAAEARSWLRPGGFLAMEHADVQGEAVPDVVRAAGGFAEVSDHRDLAGRPRVTTAVRLEA